MVLYSQRSVQLTETGRCSFLPSWRCMDSHPSDARSEKATSHAQVTGDPSSAFKALRSLQMQLIHWLAGLLKSIAWSHAQPETVKQHVSADHRRCRRLPSPALSRSALCPGVLPRAPRGPPQPQPMLEQGPSQQQSAQALPLASLPPRGWGILTGLQTAAPMRSEPQPSRAPPRGQ